MHIFSTTSGLFGWSKEAAFDSEAEAVIEMKKLRETKSAGIAWRVVQLVAVMPPRFED